MRRPQHSFWGFCIEESRDVEGIASEHHDAHKKPTVGNKAEAKSKT